MSKVQGLLIKLNIYVLIYFKYFLNNLKTTCFYYTSTLTVQNSCIFKIKEIKFVLYNLLTL